eukprot:5076349-Pleurochrysis_carterae.AAC.1
MLDTCLTGMRTGSVVSATTVDMVCRSSSTRKSEERSTYTLAHTNGNCSLRRSLRLVKLMQ